MSFCVKSHKPLLEGEQKLKFQLTRTFWNLKRSFTISIGRNRSGIDLVYETEVVQIPRIILNKSEKLNLKVEIQPSRTLWNMKRTFAFCETSLTCQGFYTTHNVLQIAIDPIYKSYLSLRQICFNTATHVMHF